MVEKIQNAQATTVAVRVANSATHPTSGDSSAILDRGSGYAFYNQQVAPSMVFTTEKTGALREEDSLASAWLDIGRDFYKFAAHKSLTAYEYHTHLATLAGKLDKEKDSNPSYGQLFEVVKNYAQLQELFRQKSQKSITA